MRAAPNDLGDERIRRRRELDAVARELLQAALANLEGARHASAVDAAVEDVVALNADEFGWEAGIIEGYAGYGIGTAIHQEPEILNYNARGISARLKPGMVLAAEPILTAGGIETLTGDDEWTVRTYDGPDAAHWRCTVMILSEGISALTAPDFGKADLAPFGIMPVEL